MASLFHLYKYKPLNYDDEKQRIQILQGINRNNLCRIIFTRISINILWLIVLPTGIEPAYLIWELG